MEERKAIYALSWDPITNWHRDVIERAAKQFGKVVVWIGINPDKKYMFSLQERVDMTKHALKDMLNIEIVAFEWLLVQYAYEQNIQIILRWIRNNTDLEYEKLVNQVNDSQGKWIETMFLFAKSDKEHISSSAAKALLKEQGNIEQYVPLNVKQALEARMNWQYFINVTGSIGTGKSYITEKLVEMGKKYQIPVTNIDMDILAHEIFEADDEPIYTKTRDKIIEIFWEEIKSWNKNYINRKKLWPIVFNNKDKLNALNTIMEEPLKTKLHRKIYKKKWLILLNGALIAETGSSFIWNNNTLLIDVDIEKQKERLQNIRGHSLQDAENRIAAQADTKTKRKLLEQKIKKDNRWQIIDFNNSGELSEEKLDELFRSIIISADIDWKLRWTWLANRVWIKNSDELFNKMKNTRDKEWRHYHARPHYIHGLNKLYRHRDLLNNPDATEYARAWHDSIMDFSKHNGENEQESAILSFTEGEKHWIDKTFLLESMKHVQETYHLTNNKDGMVMKSIDLAIFGEKREIYKEYSNNIYLEYKSIYSRELFLQWRLIVLQKFKEKADNWTLYDHPVLGEKYDTQAKENINREIEEIKKELNI